MTRLTDEQRRFADHIPGAFVEACPGAGKTRAIVARVARIAPTLPARRGLAILSFTNSAINEFLVRCHSFGLDSVHHHPGFVGTFDAFLRHFFFAPGGIEGVVPRPTVVDSWDALGVKVCLRGARAFRGDGAGLDLFNAENDQIDPGSIGHPGLRAHVRANRAAYQLAAGQRRRALRQRGYLSAADVRVDVIRRLERGAWSTALGRALAARFRKSSWMRRRIAIRSTARLSAGCETMASPSPLLLTLIRRFMDFGMAIPQFCRQLPTSTTRKIVYRSPVIFAAALPSVALQLHCARVPSRILPSARRPRSRNQFIFLSTREPLYRM